MFPGLKPEEKGKMADELFKDATAPVLECFKGAKKAALEGDEPKTEFEAIQTGYSAITEHYNKYSLQTFLEDCAEWSDEALRPQQRSRCLR